MNKTKFILLAANFALAMALTFSCSDDKDDSDGKLWCLIYKDPSKPFCAEIGKDYVDGTLMTKEICEYGSEYGIGDRTKDEIKLSEKKPDNCLEDMSGYDGE
jgi:hypothetical protein